MKSLVLASSSPARRELLSRLGLPFVAVSPEIDETPFPHEAPDRLAMRLAREKASAVVAEFPDHIIIGADQVGVLGGRLLSKPQSYREAFRQLKAASGKFMQFYTAVAVLNAKTSRCLVEVESCRVYFRPLSYEEIEAYLRRDKPFNCVGAFRSEGLGVALFRRIETDDPTSLIGLPLIKLIELLRRFNVSVLKP